MPAHEITVYPDTTDTLDTTGAALCAAGLAHGALDTPDTLLACQALARSIVAQARTLGWDLDGLYGTYAGRDEAWHYVVDAWCDAHTGPDGLWSVPPDGEGVSAQG